MAMNMDAAIRIAAKITGQQQLGQLGQSIKGIGGAASLTDRQVDRLNRVVKGTAAAAGNSTAALRNHLSALQTLRERADIGGKAYNRLGVEIDQLRGKLRALDGEAKRTDAGGMRGALGAAGGALATGGGVQSAMGAGVGALAAAGGPKGMAIAATAAAVGALTDQSVRASLALEAQSRKLRVMSSDGDNLQRSIIALTRDQNYLTSTAEASAAAYEVLQAGFSKTDDILKIVKASSLGAAGGFTDVKIVADATTSILNGYGRSAADAALIVDQMKAVTDDGKISMEAYATSIGRVIPSAAAAKLPLEEINAAIAALTAQGVPVETTFSGINQAIKTILKPTQEAKDLAKALGLEFNASALATKGLGGFLADVAQKTGKSTDALSILFSDIDGYKAVVGLLNDDLQRFNKFTDNQADALGRAANAAAIGVDPLKQYSNAWNDFAATLGSIVLPALTAVTKAATALLRSMTQGMDDFIKSFSQIGRLQGATGGGPRNTRGGGRSKAPAPAPKLSKAAQLAADRNRMVILGQNISLMEQQGRPGARTAQGAALAAAKSEYARLQQTTKAAEAAARPKPKPAKPKPEPVIPAAGVGAVPAAAGGGGGRAGGADQAAKAAAAAAAKVQSSGIELRNARELYDMEGRILDARLEDNQQLILARNAQKELAGIRQQAAAIIADKELPAAAKKNALDKLAVQSATVSRQLQFDIADLENKRAATAQESIDKLIDERELLHARLNGTETELMQRRELSALTKGMNETEKERVRLLWEQNKAMKEMYDMSFSGGFRDGLNQYVESVGTAREATAQLTQTGVKGLEDALFSLVTTGSANFQEFAANILRESARMILQLAIQRTIMQIIGAIGGGPAAVVSPTAAGGDVWGAVGRLLGNADGNAYASNGIVPFAKGGLVTAPTMFPFAKGVGLMGEAGPEAIMPLKRLPSGRLGVEAAGGGGVNVVVNVDAKGSRVEGDQQQGAALGRAISAAVQAELVKQQRPGGLLAGAR